MALRTENPSDGTPEARSLPSALKFARELGAECGRLKKDIQPAADTLEAILRKRLALLAEDMAALWSALRKQIRVAKDQRDKIELVKSPLFPVVHSRWLLAGDLLVLLVLAIADAFMAFSPLGAFPELDDGGFLQGSAAALFGVLMALIVLGTGKLLALCLKKPSDRHRGSPNRLVWWGAFSGAAFLIVCLLALPFFLAYGRSVNLELARYLAEQSGLGDFQPALGWLVVFHLAGVIVGVGLATLFFLGSDHRSFARLTEVIEAARARLEELDIAEEAKAEQEVADAIFRYHELIRYRDLAAAEADKEVVLTEVKPPDREYWLKFYHSMTKRLKEKRAKEHGEDEGLQDVG